MLRREGWRVNTKRVYRLYREEALQVRTKKRVKSAAQVRITLPEASFANQPWSMDFVSERLADGRCFRILTVVDQYTRECLCAYADRSQTGEKVSEQLVRLITLRGAPESITSDNGSEFTGKAMDHWAHQASVKLNFIRPGKPVENSYIESFNGQLRKHGHQKLSQNWGMGFCATIALATQGVPPNKEDAWKPIRFLVGSWDGSPKEKRAAEP
jgi:putative transposase